MAVMRVCVICSMLLATFVTESNGNPTAQKKEKEKDRAVYLTASDLTIATGQPSLTTMSSGSTHIPVWSLSGKTEGQSVTGLVTNLPNNCYAVKVEILVTNTEVPSVPNAEDVYRVHLSQLIDGVPFTETYSQGTSVRTKVPTEPFHTRTIVLESYYGIQPGAPLWLRIQRDPGDPADAYTSPTGLIAVKVTPVQKPADAYVVQDIQGYNSWPMIQAIGNKLVCVYSRGKAHSIGDPSRAVYAKTSTDGGKSWTEETLVANTPDYGDVAVGKGLDSSGAMLLWVRRVGRDWHQDLYRTVDGVKFDHIATPPLNVRVVQITDVFHVPTVGLMALWFAGNYADDESHSWGTLVSKDDGLTWTQTPVESNLPKSEWPTEPAAVYLGDGKLFCIARTELGGLTTERAQFQMTSTDYGKTWTRKRTNIGDVTNSTPSLVLDPQTGLLSNYYYHRGKGVLRRRVVEPNRIFDNPLGWPAGEAVAIGSSVTFDAGNVNTTVIGDTHYLSYYSGKAPDTAVLVAPMQAPTVRKDNP